MSKESDVAQEQQSLVLGDRLNWPFFLGSGMLKYIESLVREEGNLSEQQVKEATLVLSDMCPSDWVDEKFQNDVRKSFVEIDVDLRKLYCGHRVGPPKTKKELQLQPHKLVHAIIDLWYRRNLLNKPTWTEIFTGESFKGQTIE